MGGRVHSLPLPVPYFNVPPTHQPGFGVAQTKQVRSSLGTQTVHVLRTQGKLTLGSPGGYTDAL